MGWLSVFLWVTPHGAEAAPLGVVGQSIRLSELSKRCDDPRFPLLAGPWVVGCNGEGQVDRVLSLQSGELLHLPKPLALPGVGASLESGEGYLYQAGADGGLFRLSVAGVVEIDGITRVYQPLVSRPVTDGQHLALLTDGKIQAFEATQKGRRLHDALPAGWYPPAMAWPWVAWVQEGGADGQEDIWWMDASSRDGGMPLAEGPGHQRHVVGSGDFLAWVEAEAIVILDTRDGDRHRIVAQTGFSAPPSLWGDVICWESRANGRDVDIECSDGVALNQAGNQRWPARWERWLLYRQDSRLMLYTAP